MLFREYLLQEKTANRTGMMGNIPIIQVPVETIEKLEQMVSKNIGTDAGFAKVVDHPTKPGAIVKVAIVLNMEQDGQVAITNVSLQHQDNPFFPRVYSAKIYTDGDGMHILMVTMEKLVHLSDAQVESLAPIMLQNIGIDPKVIDIHGDDFGEDLKTFFEEPHNRAELVKYSNNTNFSSAMAILEPYFKKFQADFHNENIMVRVSSGAPHLVLMDPFV